MFWWLASCIIVIIIIFIIIELTFGFLVSWRKEDEEKEEEEEAGVCNCISDCESYATGAREWPSELWREQVANNRALVCWQPRDAHWDPHKLKQRPGNLILSSQSFPSRIIFSNCKISCLSTDFGIWSRRNFKIDAITIIIIITWFDQMLALILSYLQQFNWSATHTLT